MEKSPADHTPLELDQQKIMDLIQFQPTPKQDHILENLQRFNVIVGGKRVGKSKIAAVIGLIELLKPNTHSWIIAPYSALGRVIWDYIYEWSNKYFHQILKPTVQMMQIRNIYLDSIIEIKTADNPVALKGRGLDLAIGDEVGDWKSKVWEKYVEPNISEVRPSGQKGRTFLIGNANYMGSEWHKMSNQKGPGIFNYHLPTAIEEDGIIRSNNPEIITTEELIRLKKTMSVREWNNQMLAHFVPDRGVVFANILECAKGEFRTPAEGRFYTMGVDLARVQDFTVVTVVDNLTHNVVYWERFNQLEWEFQEDRIIKVAKEYGIANTRCVVDATSLGDYVTRNLAKRGLSVEGVVFNNQNKKDMVDKLSILMSLKKIKYPYIQELIEELQVYSYRMTEQNRVQYAAPSGFHDDCVTSLFLATSRLSGDPGGVQPEQTPEQILEAGKKQLTKKIFSKEGLLTTKPMKNYGV